MSRINLRIITIVIAVIGLAGCAYFNTFYNAKLFFDEAEHLREEKGSQNLNHSVINKYRDVVDKCDIVITKYPKSRYVEDAYLLKGKAQYFIGEYTLAEQSFKTLSILNTKKYSNIADYWLALIKWKTGKVQPALNDLDELLNNEDANEHEAKLYESKANIYLGIDEDAKAINSLEQAAELTKNSIDKGNIYYELALLSDKTGLFENAIINYEKAIKYSYSPDRILESHLRIVQLHRDLKQYREASSQISDMLNKLNFESIFPELNLELAKLKFAQGNNEAGVSLLDDIVVKYPKTQVSAESFYLLGNEFLFKLRDFPKADYYYQQVKVEFINSEFKETAERRMNEINQYNLSKEQLKALTQTTVVADSAQSLIDTALVVKELYNLGELEAFHFNQSDSALIYFKRIINDYPGSEIEPKTLYTLSIINQDIGDTTKSKKYEEQIILEHPNSEFADYIRTTTQNPNYGKSSFDVLHEAEKIYLINKDLALTEYKNIANKSNSEVSARAMLFIANDYEIRQFNADSSKKYYDLLIDNYPNSAQADNARMKINKLNLNSEDGVE